MKLHERLKRKEISEQALKVQLMFMEEDEIVRLNEALVIGDYAVSIQCSAGHWCNPRKTLTDFSEYKTMKMAVYLKDSLGDWSTPKDFKDFQRIEELADQFDGVVFGNLKVDVIEDFLSYLESKEA